MGLPRLLRSLDDRALRWFQRSRPNTLAMLPDDVRERALQVAYGIVSWEEIDAAGGMAEAGTLAAARLKVQLPDLSDKARGELLHAWFLANR